MLDVIVAKIILTTEIVIIATTLTAERKQYRFEKRLNHGEWLYQTVLKGTRGNNKERESRY